MPIRKVVAGLVLIAAAAFAAEPVLAQGQPAQEATASSPSGVAAPAGGISVGPLTVYPRVDLAYGHDDNLFLRPASAGIRASDFTIVSPSIRAEAKAGPHKFDIGLRIDDGRYHQSPADSYTDYTLVRLTQAPRDADFALQYVLKNAKTREEQDACVEAVRFKCNVLWVQQDALYNAYVAGNIPPGAFRPEA